MGPEQRMASIFSDASVAPAQDPLNCHTLTHAASAVPAPNVTAGAAWLSSDGEALFAMATDAGTVLLVKLPRVGIAGEFLCFLQVDVHDFVCTPRYHIKTNVFYSEVKLSSGLGFVCEILE